MPETAPTLSDLRRSLAEAALRSGLAAAGRIGLGVPALDEVLNGGLVRAALHEIYAAEVADLLATVGRSSKRDIFDLPRSDYLGQFGIGLLSCFMVSDTIVIRSRSARGGSAVSSLSLRVNNYAALASLVRNSYAGRLVDILDVKVA